MSMLEMKIDITLCRVVPRCSVQRANTDDHWPKVQCVKLPTTMMRRCVEELVGTFVLVFAGDTIGSVGVALAFGLALLAMVQILGPISGAHLNPAVTAAGSRWRT
jgi:aquaporin Z